MDSEYFNLRRTHGPYIGIPVIIVLAMGIWIPYVQKTHDLKPVWFLGALLLVSSLIPYAGSKYRIWWKDGAVHRTTAGLFYSALTTIKLEDITSIQEETSNIKTFVTMSRPLRRIVMYGNTSQGPQKIDVSLKHFKQEDVSRLMELIHKRRPDLSTAKGVRN